MKVKSLILGAALMIGGVAPAFAGMCTTSTVGSGSAVTVLAANDLGSGGRHYLTLQQTTTPTTTIAYAWCNIGATATANNGIQLQAGWLGSTSLAPAAAPIVKVEGAQLPAKTYPIAPSGAVSCIASAASQSITVCDW